MLPVLFIDELYTNRKKNLSVKRGWAKLRTLNRLIAYTFGERSQSDDA